MNYEFPIINNISDVLPAIEGRDEFVVADKGSYTVINYNVMMTDTFPTINVAGGSAKMRAERSLHNKLRRECRGIIFDSATGAIIRRPFHKFFNVNERDETQDHAVDLSRDHAILEKLDGSMIAPFLVNGQMIWGTKMGATEVSKPVEEFVTNNPQYTAFAEEMISYGFTPIFEWCSRKQRIVLDYIEDQLILTALRFRETGIYHVHSVMMYHAGRYNIPVVRVYQPQTDMRAFLEYVHDLKALEGFVVRFDDGHMLKLKCHWYLQLHKAKEAILQDRNIVELILADKLDDIKAHLPEEDRIELMRFEHLFNIHVYGQAHLISNMLMHIRDENIDRKTFAIEIAPPFDQYTRAAIFECWDETDDHKLIDCVRNTIRNNLTKTVKYEAIRDVWFNGVVYNV